MNGSTRQRKDNWKKDRGLDRRQRREDRRLEKRQRTGQKTEDLQDSEVSETTEVRLADDCQVVSVQITGREDRGQRTAVSSREDHQNDQVSCLEAQGDILVQTPTFWSRQTGSAVGGRWGG